MKRVLILLLSAAFAACCGDKIGPEPTPEPVPRPVVDPIVPTDIRETAVWTSNQYSAFTDIRKFRGKYYIAFREAADHIAYNFSQRGVINIMASEDCKTWEKVLTIEDSNKDLRDPHFCVNAAGDELYVYTAAFNPSGNAGFFPAPYTTKRSVITLSADGKPQATAPDNVKMGSYSRYWLWGVTRKGNGYYGTAYGGRVEDGGVKEAYPAVFMHSDDGVNFEYVSALPAQGNECSVCFSDDRAYVFVRSVEGYDICHVCWADPPYTSWNKLNVRDMTMECPATVFHNGLILLCVRGYKGHGIPLYSFDPSTKDLDLITDICPDAPADSAYPGIEIADGRLHISYYTKKSSDSNNNIYYWSTAL